MLTEKHNTPGDVLSEENYDDLDSQEIQAEIAKIQKLQDKMDRTKHNQGSRLVQEKVDKHKSEKQHGEFQRKRDEKAELKKAHQGEVLNLEVQPKHEEEVKEKKPAYEDEPKREKLVKKSKKRGDSEEHAREAVDCAHRLLDKMEKAHKEDRESNKNKRPALQKLLLLSEVTRELRRISVQNYFLGSGGCQILEYWLRELPDGTFPNMSLVNELLQTINTMQIESTHLEKGELAKLIQYYADHCPPHMQQVRPLAKQINDRWARMLFEINTRYDSQGEYDSKYKHLKKKVANAPRRVEKNDSNSSSEPETHPMTRIVTGQQQEEIVRGRAGIIMPHRNAFDFVERPDARGNFHGDRGNKSEGRVKLRKVMDGLKRSNKQSFGNKRMQIVKSDH